MSQVRKQCIAWMMVALLLVASLPLAAVAAPYNISDEATSLAEPALTQEAFSVSDYEAHQETLSEPILPSDEDALLDAQGGFVQITPLSSSPFGQTSVRWPVTRLSQTDPRWANARLGTAAPATTTIGRYGCVVTTAAMMQNYWRARSDIRPDNLVQAGATLPHNGWFIWGAGTPGMISHPPINYSAREVARLVDTLGPVMVRNNAHTIVAVGLVNAPNNANGTINHAAVTESMIAVISPGFANMTTLAQFRQQRGAPTQIRTFAGTPSASRGSATRTTTGITQRVVTLNPQGGTVSPTTISVNNGTAVGTLPIAARTGHTFAGWWTTASGGGTQVTASTIVTADVTFHARWNPIQGAHHQVSFNAQGGFSVACLVVEQGQAVGTLPIPTKAHHTFNGWWTAPTGGTQVTNALVPTGNKTLHARWISNAPTRITITRPESNIVLIGRTLNLGNRLNFTHNAGATPHTGVNWTSSNTNVARVNSSGVVTARNPGTATIRVRSSINENATATFNVRIEAAPTSIRTATQNITTIRMRQGRTLSLPIVVRGSTAAAQNNTRVTINWRANNRTVATLTNAGTATITGNRAEGSFRPRLNANRNLTIRAVGTGVTNIVLRSQNGRERTIRVRVVSSSTPVTRVRMNNLPNNNTMNRNRTRTLTPRITPSNATLQGNIRWSSSNRNVATIDGAGRVTTHRSGTTNITLRVGTQTHRVTLRVR